MFAGFCIRFILNAAPFDVIQLWVVLFFFLFCSCLNQALYPIDAVVHVSSSIELFIQRFVIFILQYKKDDTSG